MATRNPTPPARNRASDFSAGASTAKRTPPRRAPRAVRALGWLLLTLVALLLAVAAGVWIWAGSSTSLATALARAAQYLPAEQTLESRDVSGALRSGGRIGWLRWSSPTLAVEVTDIRLGWQLAPLLQRRLELGEVHATRVLITPQTPPNPTPDTPPTPMTELVLPIQIGVPFRVDEIQWAGSPEVEALGLLGDYRFDGNQHRLNIDQVELAQGRYSARATLQAQTPMALDLTVDGNVQTTVPGSTSTTPIQLGAHATLQGTLATAAARLELQARVSPVADAALAGATAVQPSQPASATTPSKPTAPQPAAKAAMPALTEPMQADVQASLAPWAPQPLLAATATLRAVNLAVLWPQAPVTQLHGTLQAGPSAAGTADSTANSTAAPPSGGWAIDAQLRNDLPGPWDQTRLPLTALQANATYDGTRWTVPTATLQVGNGSATAQGHYTPATGAVEGQADLRALQPDALHTALAAGPLSGRISAQTQGEAVRFNADIRAARGPSARTMRSGGTAPLRINTLTAQGSWQAPAANQSGGTLQLDRLLLDALQARAEATQLRVALGTQSAQGQLALTVPGATARANGQIAPQSGAGELEVQWSDADRTLNWLTTLPFVGTDVRLALQGATAKGAAQLTTRWKGGWQTALQQLQAAADGKTLPAGKDLFELQATLTAPQLDVTLPTAATGATPRPAATQALQLRALTATLSGSLAQATLVLNGEARTTAPQPLRATLQTRVSGGLTGAGQWQAQITELRLQAQDTQSPGPWALQLAEPLSITAANTATALTLQTSAGQARLTGPTPGTVTLRWQPARLVRSSTPGAQASVQTQGTLQGLPMAWVDALGLGTTDAATASPGLPAQPLLARMGLATSLVLDGQWNVDTTSTLRASASLRRASGDLRILAGDSTAVTAVQSSGQGAGAGAVTAIATEASASAADAASTAGSAAGVRQAEISIEAEGDALRARLLWTSDRAGEVDATVSTRLAPATADSPIVWPADAPLAGTLRARLPDVGVWSALAPPGWRVRGTLDASATLSGTRTAPRWAGTLGADDMAVRSVVDGVDLQGGRLRATLQGNQLNITEFRLQGGRGSSARIAGFSGNRTAASKDGGTLTGTGRITWGDSATTATGMSGIAMSLQAEAKALQVLVRADRQVSVSGTLQAQLQQGQISLRGKLTTDRATIILPDESAPTLGSDVVVRSKAKDRADQAKAQAAAKANQVAAQAETAKPPDIAITLNLGRDFALSGHGITTRLTGELDIRSSAVPGAPPRVTGEVRTDEGRYRAWGQSLNVETGLIRFNGPYDNPSLDILALRPNISVRAGVQVTGSAKAPRVKLYSDPELPDAEKLSWVVLGRDAAAGGAEAAVLQQAALALLGRGNNPGGGIARRLGLDEIGVKGPGSGEDATAAALTFGKRLSKDLYVTYERSLSGTLGTLYIFYDLTRSLTLRGQTGEKSAVDIIYTVKYD
ncbi:MAG: translocation/assembly module TamB domain-containing protein [Gammaproteobacteria bacterium]|nr:translocation/assembly module TamB domain-containing protein [Gammaproteobacteria bacterium]MBU1504836.1 translocation/assembly module TamB domain-containing protein [Gammaproteobacteria bacterium]MBU2122453.1 translocation/assembly module TamB domain-containing protein [Gammaproteobacteria bacterium]MBU2172121.1 translocation/assembly module TamB domain-containing protein [Gammaproteobacteria bacterium]MBU2198865.1 translocation/assembly module TamB domain-containing protein [Gammaproteobac